MKLLVMNGPNLNLLGRREPDVYGHETMEACMERLHALYPCDEILYYQSNVEGFLIDRLHAAWDEGIEGVAFNAGAYTHTSVALYDAIRAVPYPVVEVHLSNISQREEVRHRSMISAACKGVVCGFGLDSYRLAIEALHGMAR